MTVSTAIGVPDGTALEPTLWNIYVSHLSPTDKLLKFADDTTLYQPVEKSKCANRQ